MRRRRRTNNMLSNMTMTIGHDSEVKLENPDDDQDVSISNSNTASYCFFCLQDSGKRSFSDLFKKPEIVNNQISLRHLTRFLKVFEDNEEGGKMSMSEDLKRKLYKFAYDSAVFICPDCSKMMKEFTELYHLIEVTELRLNWCVQRMHHVMTKIKTETKSKSSSCKEEGNDNLLLETLRTLTIDRMSSKSSLPLGARVILPKTELSKLSSSSSLPPAALTRSKSHSRRSMNIASTERGYNAECKSEAPTTSRAVCPPLSSPGKLAEISKQEPEKVACSSSNALSVVKSSPSPSTSSSVIKTSIVENRETMTLSAYQRTSSSASHPGHEEAPAKHSYLTRSSSSNKRKSSMTCPCCPDLNTSIGNSTCESTLEPMCNSASTSTDQATTSAPTPLRKKQPGKYLKCSLCRAQFPTQTSGGLVYGRRLLRRHTLTYHCEQFFPIQDYKLDSVSGEQYTKILSQLLFKDFISGKKACSFCGNIFTTYSRKRTEHISLVKSHLVEFHFPQVKEILIQIQRDPDLQKKLDECNPNGKLCECGVYLANQDSQTRHRHKKLHCTLTLTHLHNQDDNFVSNKNKNQIRKNKLSAFKIQRTLKHSFSRGICRRPKGKVGGTATVTRNCSYCRFKSDHSSVFTMHRVSFHPEHFFSDVWNAYSRVVTKDQFQRIVHNILLQELLPKTGEPLSCHFCGIHCNDKPKLKRHLVRSHEHELKERLRMILRDPNLLEKLKNMNTLGVSCPCGIYVPPWTKSSKEYHEMYHCKLTVKAVKELSSDDLNGQEVSEIFGNDRSSSTMTMTTGRTSHKPTEEVASNSRSMKGISQEALSVSESSIFPLPSSCPYCLYQITNSASMSRHLLRFHPQYYFPHVDYHVLGVKPDQFQRVIHDILFPEFASVSAEGMSSCGLCGEQFNGKYNYTFDAILRRHFTSRHTADLTDRLLVILKAPNLDEKLQKANPHGKSCPCGVYLPSESSPGESYHEKFHCKLKLPEREPGGSGYYEITTVRKEMFDDQETEVPSKSKPSSSKSKSINSSVTTLKCSYCLAKFSCKQTQKWKQAEYLRQHLLRYHCHHYFPNHKLEHVTDPQFHKILAELLFKDLIEEGKSCVYCDKTFIIASNREMKRLNLFRHKMHLIKEHYKELEVRLKDIQSDPNLSQRLSECDSSNGRMCRFKCGVYLSNVFSRATHEKLHCTKAASASKRKLPAANTSEDAPKRKRCRKQVLSLRTQAPSSSFSLTATTTTETTIFGGGNEDNAKFEDENESITFPKSCPYCRYVCDAEQAKNSMARHLSRYHPQYYFPKLDYEAMGVSQDQFQRVLHDIIFSELVPVVGDTTLCRFCGKRFQEKDQTASNLKLRRHLVRIHGKELEDQIRVILRDPNLDERLARANLGGMSCPCGMYLPQGLGHKDNHHEKFQCNILTPKKAEDEDYFIGGMEVDVDDVGPEVDNDSSIDVKYNVTVGVLENVQVPGLSEELDLSDEDEYGFNEHAHLGTYQEENKDEFLDDESDPLKLE